MARPTVPTSTWGDEGESPIVIVEGEAKAEELYEALYTDEGLQLPTHAVGAYPHGALSAHKADYSIVRAARSLSGPIPTNRGKRRAARFWRACEKAGATALSIVRGPAPDDLNVTDKLAALGKARAAIRARQARNVSQGTVRTHPT